MARVFPLLLACSLAAVACGRSPTGPTDAARAARLSRTRFLAFGDSLTTGEVTNPISASATKLVVVPSASYPSVLRTELQQRYVSQASDITMINAGLGGETIVSAVLRFEDVLDTNRPEVVLMMHGVNGLTAIGPDVSAVLMQSMAQTAKARNLRVFVASMLPTIAGRQRSQDQPALEAYNARLRAMCVLEGVPFVDLYGALLPDVVNVIGIDGLHPTEAGYRRVADLFFSAIRNELEGR